MSLLSNVEHKRRFQEVQSTGVQDQSSLGSQELVKSVADKVFSEGLEAEDNKRKKTYNPDRDLSETLSEMSFEKAKNSSSSTMDLEQDEMPCPSKKEEGEKHFSRKRSVASKYSAAQIFGLVTYTRADAKIDPSQVQAPKQRDSSRENKTDWINLFRCDEDISDLL